MKIRLELETNTWSAGPREQIIAYTSSACYINIIHKYKNNRCLRRSRMNKISINDQAVIEQ